MSSKVTQVTAMALALVGWVPASLTSPFDLFWPPACQMPEAEGGQCVDQGNILVGEISG